MPKSIPEVPNAAHPIGPYSVAAEANGFVFISGQVGINPTTSIPAGDNVVDQTRRTMENIKLVLGDLGLGFDDIVKTTIFLTDMADFPLVNDVYASYMGDAPPARSTIQAGALPGGFLVEIEVIAAR